MPIPRTLASLILPATLFLSNCTATPSLLEAPMQPIIHAPDFPADFAWLNTDQPLSLKTNLRGQIVIMDFWCYCCINCMHILPDLAYLEEKYKNDPVVILGVHSNKYDNESDPANIRAAIQRYNIHHPVLVDQRHTVWSAYDVSAWPTIVVVGPDGRIVGGISGEGHSDLLDKVIARTLADARKNNTLAQAPLKLAQEGQVRAATGLSFPGKVIPDTTNSRLFILDSNHNRIVITSLPDSSGHADLLATVGTGAAGSSDGAFDQASFNRPQGGTLLGNALYIADTENHLIRRIDLEKKTVTTILGTGKQDFDPEAGKSGRQQGLNSPWDLAIFGNRLYIAQAGQHQIFAMNLMTGMTEVAAGSARENIRDGTAKEANLAQPSGLALDTQNAKLYFADSEVSAIRSLDLKTNAVKTLVGHGLFTFGDRDGDANSALLQHALGVAVASNGKLFVADTYNHKIKELNTATGKITTVAGTGKPGAAAGSSPAFFEPASVAASGNSLFVTDTNNHRILQADLSTNTWSELVINGLTPPHSALAESMIPKDARSAGTISLPPSQLLTLNLTLPLPLGHHLTEGAPISLQVTDGTRTLHTTTLSPSTSNHLVAQLPAAALAAKPATLYVTVFYTHCTTGLSAVCTPATISWKITPSWSDAAKPAMNLAP